LPKRAVLRLPPPLTCAGLEELDARCKPFSELPRALAAATSPTLFDLTSDDYYSYDFVNERSIPMRYGRGADALLLGLPRLRRLGLYTAPPGLWAQLRRAPKAAF
jgi:hypothetical protein